MSGSQKTDPSPEKIRNLRRSQTRLGPIEEIETEGASGQKSVESL